MLDTARPGMPRRDVVRGEGWPGHARPQLVELSVMEQRYHAVMEVVSGARAPVSGLGIKCPAWHAQSMGTADLTGAGLDTHRRRRWGTLGAVPA
jgi:hypothetical protein